MPTPVYFSPPPTHPSQNLSKNLPDLYSKIKLNFNHHFSYKCEASSQKVPLCFTWSKSDLWYGHVGEGNISLKRGVIPSWLTRYPSSMHSRYLLRTTSSSCQTHHIPPYLDGSCKPQGSYPGSQCWRGHCGPQRGPWCSCPIPKCSAGRQGELGIKKRLILCDCSPNPNYTMGSQIPTKEIMQYASLMSPEGPIPRQLLQTQIPPLWPASRASLLHLDSSPLPVCSIFSWECFCYCPVYLPQQSHKSPCLLWTLPAHTTGSPEVDRGRRR